MVFTILQIIVSVLLIGSILLQSPGTGLTPVLGGGGEAYRSKRSAQKFLLYATIGLTVLLVLLTLIQLFLQRS